MRKFGALDASIRRGAGDAASGRRPGAPLPGNWQTNGRRTAITTSASRRLAPIIMLTLTAALSACSSGSSNQDITPKAVPDTTSATPPPSATPLESPLPAPSLPDPKAIANEPSARAQVKLTGCDPASNPFGWQASGTATNPRKRDAAYTITVFFTTPGNTVVDSATTTVTVKPGQTTDWKASKALTGPKDLRCVLRGVG